MKVRGRRLASRRLERLFGPADITPGDRRQQRPHSWSRVFREWHWPMTLHACV